MIFFGIAHEGNKVVHKANWTVYQRKCFALTTAMNAISIHSMTVHFFS